ncbi:MAG: hypothetical protein EBR82_12110 [Caulobacteraceae bacterium]|nr:hypothetical protein [Caulobacteraceae bacterium]
MDKALKKALDDVLDYDWICGGVKTVLQTFSGKDDAIIHLSKENATGRVYSVSYVPEKGFCAEWCSAKTITSIKPLLREMDRQEKERFAK